MTDIDDSPPLKLIETIYRAALDPQGYDVFMRQWHDWMTARIGALDRLRDTDSAMSSPEIAAHFELALRVLERLGEARSSSIPHGPQLLMDSAGRILWQNAEADRLLGSGRGRSLQNLDLPGSHRARLADYLSRLPENSTQPPLVIQITPPDDTRTTAFRVEQIREGADSVLAILSSLAPAWPARADHLLMETHRLSAAECAVCAQLIEGLPPATIAQRRGTSLATVRTQIKKILAKTRQGSLSELTAYLHSLLRLADTMPEFDTAPALPAPLGGALHDVTVHGRRLIIEEHGPRTGYPVVFLHGMLDGTGITASAHQALHRYNLRLICPHRPGFGQSEPVDGPLANVLEQVGRDLASVLSRWGINAPVMLGHLGGSLYAVAAAAPCGACGIVNVAGGVPIISPAQFDSMTKRQRLVAYTARYAPSVLPFVINAGIRQIKGGGGDTFLRSLYENAPVDSDVLRDDKVRALMLAGHQFTLAQGHIGFATDSYHVVRDWTPMFMASAPIPVRLIHGAHDPVVSARSVQEFAARHADRVELDLLDDAGQLLFYRNADRVFATVRRVIDHAQGMTKYSLHHGKTRGY